MDIRGNVDMDASERVMLTHPGQEFPMFLNRSEFMVFGEHLQKCGWSEARSCVDRPVKPFK